MRVIDIILKIESKKDIMMNRTMSIARSFSFIKVFSVPCWMQSVQQ